MKNRKLMKLQHLHNESVVDSEETDEGPKKIGRERLCVATREVRPVQEMLRFVVGLDRELIFDVKCRLPGRGVWIVNDCLALRKAVKQKSFLRGFKREVIIYDKIEEIIERQLKQDALEILSIVNKAGALVTGFKKIDSEKAKIIGLLQAEDGSEHEKVRLQRRLKSRFYEGSEPEWVFGITAEEIRLSIGQENVIHAALIDQGISFSFLYKIRRWKDFLSGGMQKYSY